MSLDGRRRRLIFVAMLSALFSHAASSQVIRVTLLGTGTPGPTPDRFGPSTLVEAGEERLIFDAGRGASIRLAQSGVALPDISAVFITHFHSDHLNGLSDLWMSGYMAPSFRDTPLKLYGPAGILDLARGLEAAYRADVDIRAAEYEDLGIDFYPEGAAFDVFEFDGEETLYEEGGVVVTPIAVEHGVGAAFGYRVDYAGRSVVISGDTSPSDNLIEKARGVDLIVHEVMAFEPELLRSSSTWQGIKMLHTTPHEAGSVFRQIGPKMAVYNHIGLIGVTADILVPATRETYSGPLAVGHDLMTFLVGDDVSVETQR